MKTSGCVLVMNLLFSVWAFAAPETLTYQGRILNTNGQPLEYSAVSFEFRITNPSGSCIIYREQKSGVDMTNSKGVFDTPIGEGTQLFPTDPLFTLLNAFSNSGTLQCEGGATYTPLASDGRLLRVRFHDGTGWKTISPDNTIRSVPYAAYAANATKFAGKEATEFVLKTGIPTCGTGFVLTSTSAGVLTCTPDTGGAAGIVNTIAGTSPIVATNDGSGGYTISATVGTTAGTLAAGNDSRFTNSRAPTGPASGDLTGNYPAPSIADDAVTTVKVLDAAITNAKIADANVTAAKLAAGTAAGQVPRFNGTAWTFAKLNFGDLVNAAGNSPWPSGSCALNQFITWVSVTDGFSCASLNSSMVTTALGFTPVTNARVVSTGTATTTGLTGGGALTSDLNLAVNVGTGANQIPQLDGSGKLLSSILPSGITDGAWTAASGDVYRSTGNVGIGTSTPGYSLDVRSASNLQASFGSTGANSAFLAINNGTAGYQSAVAFKDAGVVKWQVGKNTDNSFFIYDQANTKSIITSSGTSLALQPTSGNVGIGTTTPETALHIIAAGASAGTLGYQAALSSTAAYNASPVSGVMFKNQFRSADTATAQMGGIGVGKENTTDADYSSYLALYTRKNGSSLSERLRIDSSGNVGIGTTAPTTKLEVAGTIKATAFEGPLTATTNTSGAGSNSAPSYSFSADPDTGFYNAASDNTISVSNGGAKSFDFTSVGLISPTTGGAHITTAAGTAALPTYSFAGDADTGWWSPASDTMAASTAGAERMRIDSSGNVGIGVTNPSEKLSVVGQASIKRNSATVYASSGTTSGPVNFVLALSNDTAADNNSAIISSRVRNTGVVYQGGYHGFIAQTAGYSPAFVIGRQTGTSAYAESLRIDSAGYVGIGTTNPLSMLHVYTPNANGIIVERSGGANAGIEYKHSGGSMFAGLATNLNFSVGTNSNLNAGTFQVTPAGNVGIGTTSPTSVRSVNLDVSGTGSTNGGAAIIATKNGTGLATFRLQDSTGTKGFDINYNDNAAYAPGTDSIGFYDRAAAAYRLAITPAGYVGLGTSVPNSPLQVAFSNNNTTAPTSAAAIKIQNTDNTVGNMASVLFNEGTTSATSGASIAALFEEHDTTPATSLLFHTSNGTSFAERMRVTSAGNVGIGLMAPKNKLDVSGSVNSSGGYRMNAAWNGSAYTTVDAGFSGIMYTDVTSGGMHFATSPSSIAAGAVTTIPIVMSISKDARVGIGTTTPDVALETVGEIRAAGTVNGFTSYDRAGGTSKMIMYLENGYLKFADYGAGARMVINRTTGQVGMGTTTPGYALEVVGDTYTSGYFRSPNGTIQTSDVRFKRNIAAIEDSLGKIISLNGVTYDWRKEEYPERGFTDRHQMGVIAQEVERQFPEAVVTDKSGYKSVNYASLIAPVINSIKELYAQVLGTQSEVEALKKDHDKVLRELASVQADNQKFKAENIEIKARLEKLEAKLNKK